MKIKKLSDFKFINSLTKELISDKLTPESSSKYSSIPRQVFDAHFSFVTPEQCPDAKLISISNTAAELLDLSVEEFPKDQLLGLTSGNLTPSNTNPWSLAYGGHQFGSWAGQLGDGRAISIGSIVNSKNEIWELQLKGAGMTPYSRFADGYAVIRSSVREYLCSEAMSALKIPTSRALSIVTSSREVPRETIENCAVVCRLAPSWIRFGNFELFYSRGDLKNLKILADFTIRHHFPEAELHDNGACKYIKWLSMVVEKTAFMIAKWQAFGFCHGVMNTDNFSILGLTIDYGPFQFLDTFEKGYVCNTSDYTGRYSFENQPNIAIWNLSRLASAISPLVMETYGKDKSKTESELTECVMEFKTLFQNYYSKFMLEKIGIFSNEGSQDMINLVEPLLVCLEDSKSDYTDFFRKLCYFNLETFEIPAITIENQKFADWKKAYALRLKNLNDGITLEKRQERMKSVNPMYILRNHLVQDVIKHVEMGSSKELEEYLRVLMHPFDEQPGIGDKYTRLPKENEMTKCSCSS